MNNKKQYVVYAYVDITKDDEVLYVGIAKDDGSERHANHLKPSKALDHGGEESFNFWLQTNTEKWDYIILSDIKCLDYEDAKAVATAAETIFIDRYRPKYNKLKVMYEKEV